MNKSKERLGVESNLSSLIDEKKQKNDKGNPNCK